MENPLQYYYQLSACNLFRFDRITFLLPFTPTTLESVNLSVSHLHQLQCHTGTGSFSRSGTVENNRPLLSVIINPLRHVPGVDSFRARDLVIGLTPVTFSTHIENNKVSFTEAPVEFIGAHQRNCCCTRCKAHDENNYCCRNGYIKFIEHGYNPFRDRIW